MRGPLVFLAGLCVAARRWCPGCWSRRSRGSARARSTLSRGAGAVRCRAPGALPTLALAVGARGAGRRARGAPRAPSRGAEPGVGVRPARRAGAGVDLGRVHQAAAAVAGGGPAPEPRADACASSAASLQEVAYEAEVPHLFDTLLYEPVTARRAARRGGRAPSAVGQPAHLPALSARRCSACCSRSRGSGCSR